MLNVTLNQRLLTQNIQAGGLVNLSYTYDVGSNVTSITDGINSSKPVTMGSGSYDLSFGRPACESRRRHRR